MTAFEMAQRFVGEVSEGPGAIDDPFIQWCLASCGFGPNSPDETPWCSAFVNRIAWLLRLPRSKSAAARSWLTVGQPIDLAQAVVGYDVVVLSRGINPTQGHVGFFAGLEGKTVHLLGGNQSDGVTVAAFPVARVLGVRRLA